ncbi:hypothetical protein [Enterococcus sp.]|uniref:hypothetical protein n=1 Tax=Enterococcus sp. TaxID=35783 RepID=UPI002FCACD04
MNETKRPIGYGHKMATMILVDHWQYREIKISEKLRSYEATIQAASDYNRDLAVSVQLDSTGEWLEFKGQQVILKFDTGEAIFAS